MSKLDLETRNKYNEAQDFKELPSWNKCQLILSLRCRILENKVRTTEIVPKQTPTHNKGNGTFKRSTPLLQL